MTHKIDHIGIAVRGLEERLKFWSGELGLEVGGIETVETEQVKLALLPVGGTRIELIEPTAEDSAVAKFLAKRGEGLHHIAMRVDNLEQAVERMKEAGVVFVGAAPRPGAEGSSVAFVHPKSAGGVLLELVQSAPATEGTAEIKPGAAVLLYLRDPQEKLWGVLRRLDPSGVVLQGIDLASFDDWVAQIERGEESVVGPSLLFMPMARLEKILLDRSSGHLPSLAERFQRRTGRSVQEVLDAGD